MVLLQASLFLPYTIQFDANKSAAGHETPDADPCEEPPCRLVPESRGLLPPETPPDSPELEGTPFGRKVPLNSPALHFVRPANPRTLSRADSQAPEWGRGRIFNQPTSKVAGGLPSTILEYQKANETLAASEFRRLRAISESRTRRRSNRDSTPARSSSKDKSTSHSDWSVAPAIQGNGALTNAIQAAIDGHHISDEVHHFGTLGFPTDDLSRAKKDEISDFLDSGYDSRAIFVRDSDFDGHYIHYCKTILWPVFNYQIPDHPKSKAYADHSWQFYVKINEAFADAIVRHYKHGDTIWVHDYHLLLLPAMLRGRLPEAKIGFFLHNAFPSSEIFRCLAMRKELLLGILGANAVVFQVEEYAYHFKQTCRRLLNMETKNHGVEAEDRLVSVSAIPIGTVRDKVLQARDESEVGQWVQTLSDKYKGKKIIASRDKMDSVRGVKQKLLAFEVFLERNPEWRKDLVLIQVVLATKGDDKDLDASVSDIVTRINAKFSTLAHSPIVFLRQDIAFAQYLALLTVADVLMVTPLRDGMNLTCHDFIECQDGQGLQSKKHGPIILSEFAGSAAVFGRHVITVNPWDFPRVARAIKCALEMEPGEKELNYNALWDIASDQEGAEWPAKLTKQLDAAYQVHQHRDTHSVPRLPINTVWETYKSCTHRLFVFDYEDTLDHSSSEGLGTSSVSSRTMDTLQDLLMSSSNNTVYIVSSKTAEELEAMFHEVFEVGLIAEDGCFVRPFGCADWVSLVDQTVTKDEWKAVIKKQLQYYHERIEGSGIEERGCSLIFHYDGARAEDEAIAARQAGEMVNHINEGCQAYGVRAVQLEKAVSIQPRDVSRVTACQWILNDVQGFNGSHGRSGHTASSTTEDYYTGSPPQAHAGVEELHTISPITSRSELPPPQEDQAEHNESAQPSQFLALIDGLRKVVSHERPSDSVATTLPDFLMVAGDAREDEPVYAWANQLQATADGRERENKIKNVFSVCVTKKNTEASYTLTQGVNGLLSAIRRLADY